MVHSVWIYIEVLMAMFRPNFKETQSWIISPWEFWLISVCFKQLFTCFLFQVMWSRSCCCSLQEARTIAPINPTRTCRSSSPGSPSDISNVQSPEKGPTSYQYSVSGATAVLAESRTTVQKVQISVANLDGHPPQRNRRQPVRSWSWIHDVVLIIFNGK